MGGGGSREVDSRGVGARVATDREVFANICEK